MNWWSEENRSHVFIMPWVHLDVPNLQTPNIPTGTYTDSILHQYITTQLVILKIMVKLAARVPRRLFVIIQTPCETNLLVPAPDLSSLWSSWLLFCDSSSAVSLFSSLPSESFLLASASASCRVKPATALSSSTGTIKEALRWRSSVPAPEAVVAAWTGSKSTPPSPQKSLATERVDKHYSAIDPTLTYTGGPLAPTCHNVY